MYKEKTIAVVIPAYNEEKLIGRTIGTLPDFVDQIVVVDDCSRDQTSAIVERYVQEQPERVHLIRHESNQGVGGSLSTGFRWCLERKMDVSVIMNGDAQMDPEDLPNLLDPVVEGRADFSKGNRLISGKAWSVIPRVRYLGNAGLSLLTKIASGYWHVGDSQTGYVAASLKVLQTLNLDKIYKRYGMPNDLLVRLNIHNIRVVDVEVKPVYGIGERSGFIPVLLIPKLSWLLLKLFIFRMIQKYVIRDFHPLVFFYLSGILMSISGFLMGLFVVYHRLFVGSVNDNTPIFTVFLLIFGWQFILFAMWFDMEYNRPLR